jgi:hypothetical protein
MIALQVFVRMAIINQKPGVDFRKISQQPQLPQGTFLTVIAINHNQVTTVKVLNT